MTKLLISLAVFVSPLIAVAQPVWQADCGDGTYRNPVLYADYSDPDVCAVGGDYFLTASSFHCVPGLPILHSRDLVSWHIIGHALKELLPREVFDRPQHGKGVWAPSIRYHEGFFYIYWGDPDRGIFMVKASDPSGQWSQPVCVLEGRGMIDPCPLWDDDGRCYLVHAWAASRAGFNSVLTVRELSADGTQAIGQPRIVFDGGQENHTAEGPKLYKRDGYYWILCPAGGVAMGWQLAMRSPSVYGPYEWRRVLWQGRTDINGPHQGAWVSTPCGEDWFLHFNDKGAYGRVVYLQPVDWSSGWPMMGNNGEPYDRFKKPGTAGMTNDELRMTNKGMTNDELQMTNKGMTNDELRMTNKSNLSGSSDSHSYSSFVIRHSSFPKNSSFPKDSSFVICHSSFNTDSDEFDGGTMWLQWQWQDNYDATYGMPTADGYMRLYTYDVERLWDAPNLLLQKLAAPSFTATTKLHIASKDDGQACGVVMMGMNYEALLAERRGDAFVLMSVQCADADTGGLERRTDLVQLSPTARDTIPYSPAVYLDIFMRMTVHDGHCRFAYSLDGKRFKSLDHDFVMRQGKWVGAKMGLVAVCRGRKGNRGWLDADWFRVTRH